jgi:hypothetical protein
MSVNPVLAAEKQLRLQRIEEFLQSKVWFIGPDRPQTRRVLVDLLALVPEEVLNSLFAELRLLIIAPRRRSSEVISYHGLPIIAPVRRNTGVTSFRGAPSQPTLDALFIVVTLDWSIEDSTRSEAFRTMAGILGDALMKLSGLVPDNTHLAAWSEATKGLLN